MSDPSFVILYGDNPPASVAFYTALLGKPPVESSPTFAMFALESGVMLGLWSRRTVEPAVSAASGQRARVSGRRCRCGAIDARRLEQTRPDHRAGADRYGFRPHVRGARSGRASAARVCADCVMSGNWIAVASAEHVRWGREAGFMQVSHGKAAPLRRVRPDDRVACYSPTATFGGKDKLQAFTAIGVVSPGEPYQVDMGDGFLPPSRRHLARRRASADRSSARCARILSRNTKLGIQAAPRAVRDQRWRSATHRGGDGSAASDLNARLPPMARFSKSAVANRCYDRGP